MRVWGLCVFLCVAVYWSSHQPTGFQSVEASSSPPFFCLFLTAHYSTNWDMFAVCISFRCACAGVYATWSVIPDLQDGLVFPFFFYCYFTRRLLLPVNQSAKPQEFKPLFIHHALSSISSLNSELMCVCTCAYACIQDQCQKDAGFTESNTQTHTHIFAEIKTQQTLPE